VFNLQNPIFQDRRVRQAISLLWDFEWTNRQMMRNLYMRQQSFFPRVKWPPPPCPTPRTEILEPLRGRSPTSVHQVFRRRKPMAAATSATSSCKP
jgi:microcin C transport system substrate-binding protein